VQDNNRTDLRLWVLAIALGSGCLHCTKSEPVPPPAATTPQPSAAAAPRAQGLAAAAPPRVEFVAPQPWQAQVQPWQSKKPDLTPVQPPDLAEEVWRAFVSQNEPIQIKTPRWQALPADQTVELQMAEDSHFRCQVTPLVITPEANDFNTKLKAWVMSRTLMCSDDGWKNWTEYSHTVHLAPGGERKMFAVPEALLRERQPDGSVRQTFVILRSDKEQRDATTGPPRILTGVEVDDD
jgi:hypothetical protein